MGALPQEDEITARAACGHREEHDGAEQGGMREVQPVQGRLQVRQQVQVCPRLQQVPRAPSGDGLRAGQAKMRQVQPSDEPVS